MARLRFTSKKINPQVFWDEFNRHQTDGFIGDPLGEDGYGYLRVSSDKQAAEGETGIPRQIENLHKAAKRDHVRIHWDMLFGDDESGYLLERPALNDLLRETAKQSRGSSVVFENISRMSREWQWQQGWLIWQFETLRKMSVHFFDEAGSALERSIKGYVADEGMRVAKENMKAGRRKKAQQGFITPTSKDAFGYKRVAKDGYDPEKVREFPTYKPRWDPEPDHPNGCRQRGEAHIIVELFEAVAYEGISTWTLSERLNHKYGPPGKSARWESSLICKIVNNPVYYGEFVSNRSELLIMEELHEDGNVTRKKVLRNRPREEWNIVPVEPIISKELWELANIALAKNKRTSFRNAKKHDYLLTGLLKCWECGRAWTTCTNSNIGYYRCSTRGQRKVMADYGVSCSQKMHIQTAVLEAAVWSVVRKIIYEPETFLEYLDNQFMSESNLKLQSQIEFITSKIRMRKQIDEHDRELYDHNYMKVDEYGPKHQEAAEQITKWEAAIVKIQKRLITREHIERSKQRLLALGEQAKKYEDRGGEVPFDVKRNLIKMSVEKIYVNTNRGLIRILGEIGDYTRPIASTINGQEPEIWPTTREDAQDMGDEGNDDIFVQTSSR